MVLSYKDAVSKYKSNYQLYNAINNKELYKIEPGVYSDRECVNYLSVLNLKYPNAVFTSDSAYYYHNLTDVIPRKYFLSTRRKASKINDSKVKQVYTPDEKFDVGITCINIGGIEIKIYDKERILIDLVNKSEKIPFDYYKEIINNYRETRDTLDMNKIVQYLSYYKNAEELFLKIQKEVF